MDVLVSMGTNASYIYSLISMLHHHIMVCSCGGPNGALLRVPPAVAVQHGLCIDWLTCHMLRLLTPW